MRNEKSLRILLGKKEIAGYSIKKPVELELIIKKVVIPENESPKLNWKLEEIREYTAVSICGEVWYSNYKDCIEAGQIRDTVRELFPQNEAVLSICRLWEEWHLNDLTAETIEQSYFIEGYKAGNPDWPYDFSEACDVLRNARLYRIKNGSNVSYSYGSKWLIREIPETVVNRLIELFGMFPEGKGE